jgi:hypothetical protein
MPEVVSWRPGFLARQPRAGMTELPNNHPLSPATRDSTKSITFASSFTPSRPSVSYTPVGLVTFKFKPV